MGECGRWWERSGATVGSGGSHSDEVSTAMDNRAESDGPLVFRGTFYHNLDEKGRVSIPSAFRQLLAANGEDTLVLTNFITDGARCLDAYPMSAWAALERKLANRSRFDPKVRTLEHFVISRAQVCPLDSSGRINIASHLRAYAGLEKEIAFAASLHGFRLWDRRVHELVFREAEAALLENPDLFRDLDL